MYAQFNLGNIYLTGESVKEDHVQAVVWYRMAADQGLAEAQNKLGVRYIYGEGVAKDEIEAYAYWSLASKTDDDARKNLVILEKKLSGDEISAGKKRSKQLQNEVEARKAGK